MKFSDITGQEDIKQRLRQLADDDKIPHALLLEGKSGIGKMMLARAFAQYIHCQNRVNGDSCGVCASCRQHQSFNHIDTIFSFPVLKRSGESMAISDDYAKEWQEYLREQPYMPFEFWQRALGNENGKPMIYVHESMSVIRKLNFASHGSKYKIVIMWLPERMNPECSNKMLKIIEEPPRDTIFIFTSNNPQAILPTIYSRLQRYQVKPLTENEVVDVLTSRFGENYEAAVEASRLSGGSVNVAQNLASSMGEHAEMLESFKELMRSAYQRRILDLRKWSDTQAKQGREYLVRFLNYCENLIGENFIYNLHNQQLNALSTAEADFSNKFARFINERNVERLRKVFIEAAEDISGYTNPKMVMFDVAVKTILLLKA
ncbi:MAG: DNA polymerase III subunit delta [Muribaculaceae bacterium]|nr:DNA polymerase III subunit delta [Muribaculaceae bacterium]